MLYYLLIEYEENGLKKSIEKFFNSEIERDLFIKEFKKGEKNYAITKSKKNDIRCFIKK